MNQPSESGGGLTLTLVATLAVMACHQAQVRAQDGAAIQAPAAVQIAAEEKSEEE